MVLYFIKPVNIRVDLKLINGFIWNRTVKRITLK